MTKPWLFGIGTPKTGGHSLAAALQILGFSVYHFGHEVFNDRTGAYRQLRQNMDDKVDPLTNISGVDALVDWPICDIWPDILKRHGDAKFIMTYRDPHASALSWCRQMMTQTKFALVDKHYKYADAVRRAEKHIDEVVTEFLPQSQKLLILDTADSDATKWRLLCQFLDKPVPDVPYPHAFNHAEWQLEPETIARMRAHSPH